MKYYNTIGCVNRPKIEAVIANEVKQSIVYMIIASVVPPLQGRGNYFTQPLLLYTMTTKFNYGCTIGMFWGTKKTVGITV